MAPSSNRPLDKNFLNLCKFYPLKNLTQVTLDPKGTPLLACTIVSFDVEFGNNFKRIAFEVWEGEGRHPSREDCIKTEDEGSKSERRLSKETGRH